MSRRRGITLVEVMVVALILIVLAAIFVPVHVGDGRISPRVSCLSNVKQLTLGVLVYAADHDDRLPRASLWRRITALKPSDLDEFRCPVIQEIDPTGYGYAFHRKLALRPMKTIDQPQRTAMIFESSDLSLNASTGLDSLPRPGRHGNDQQCSNNIAYLDGHAKSIPMPAR